MPVPPSQTSDYNCMIISMVTTCNDHKSQSAGGCVSKAKDIKKC